MANKLRAAAKKKKKHSWRQPLNGGRHLQWTNICTVGCRRDEPKHRAHYKTLTMVQLKHHTHFRCSSTSNTIGLSMSIKYALIFALAALCCLVATEAAAQRRNGLARAAVVQADENKTAEIEGRQAEDQELDEEVEQEEEGDQDQAAPVQAQENEQRTVPDNRQNALRETVVRPSNDDARARRVVRRGTRRGPRRNRSSRRRRGGRRRGGRRNRGGNRRRNNIRRRNGRPLRG